MPEVSRSDVARDLSPPAVAPEFDLPELPERASPASNPALNGLGEAVGRRVGTAVAGVRRLPQQIDKLRSKIHLVDRQSSTMKTAAELRDAAGQRISEFTDQAGQYTHEVADRANRRMDELKQRLQWRVDELRRSARRWMADAQHWETERPLQVIAGCAAAAFLLGVALRVRRSYRD